eukprot:TRINITY_DN10116_c0_g1_i1.p1 TRINITY_DN10116_c0_g1~~TRINITY_DN10116_c0_g1_i1.p1  ORF type:complete len:335 (+),score=70.58 TRINITY_DN10116_c0_g1_i1:76-1080(+)
MSLEQSNASEQRDEHVESPEISPELQKRVHVVNLNRILVPLDGTAASHRALTHALAIAACFSCQVKLVHVVDTNQLYTYERHQMHEAERLLEHMSQVGESILRRASKLLTDSGVHHSQVLVKGTPEAVIKEESSDCDFIVMGSHGLKGFERFLLGSVTEGTLRHTHLPVLGVRFRDADSVKIEDSLPTTPYKRILVPYDGGIFSQYALKYILPFVAGMSAELLTLLYVTDANPSASKLASAESFLEEAKQTSMTALAALRQQDDTETVVAVKVERTSLHPAEAIINSSSNYDLIVCGTRGLTGLKRLFLGSVTEGVFRRSLVPVLAIHSPESGH